MNLVRFIGLLFVFIGVLASCATAVALLVLMLRFWLLALVIVLACVVFRWVLSQENSRSHRPTGRHQ
ncbi:MULTISPECIES: hypothetical protein [Pseudomonas]|uniref:hypothetical protein n=1 Tax=Pseudomonas TaxID=286 RepID=UPI000EB091A6|nr:MULTISPECIES: hypothetical protein [Pseudomonas]MBI8111859.1 hypothetical protein [Pseudomonas aeruginosa]MBI8241799.1 hypothetical protein [Pseudomonas aeruginosa]MBI8378419.1 hypothetical protein [Pseudomonas aeruginosa]MCV0236645.1 hypothetical protein [Pseudomonas aeruginosa]MDV6731367.1 hypothetical protein [Pseudomonas aeruginosa]